MDLSPGLNILRRHWLAVLAITLIAGAVGYGASFLMDPSYSASTRLLVRAREARLLTSSGQDLSRIPGVLDSNIGKPLTQTYSGMVQSRTVAEQVVHDLGLDKPRPQDDSLMGQLRSNVKLLYRMGLAYAQHGFFVQPAPFEQAVGFVQNNVEAKPIKDSYLVEIKAKADRPDLAMAVADSVAKVFMRESRERFEKGAASYSSFLKQEMENFRKQAEQGQQAVRLYKDEKGVTDVSEQVRLSAAAYQNAQNELTQTAASLDEARARYDSLQTELGRLNRNEVSTTTVRGRTTTESPETASTVTVQDDSPTTTVVEIPGSASVVETGRNRTTTTSDPSRTTTTVNGGSTTSRSDTTRTQTSNGTTTEEVQSIAPNRVYQDVLASSLKLKSEMAGLQARHESLAASLRARTGAAELTEAEAKLTELQLIASTSADAYKRIGVMYENALLNDSWGTEEVTLIDNAAAPLYPDGPKRYLFALIGLLCGIVGGAGIASTLDGMRKRFAGPFLPPLAPRPVGGSVAQPPLSGAMHFAAGEQAPVARPQSDGARG